MLREDAPRSDAAPAGAPRSHHVNQLLDISISIFVIIIVGYTKSFTKTAIPLHWSFPLHQELLIYTSR